MCTQVQVPQFQANLVQVNSVPGQLGPLTNLHVLKVMLLYCFVEVNLITLLCSCKFTYFLFSTILNVFFSIIILLVGPVF